MKIILSIILILALIITGLTACHEVDKNKNKDSSNATSKAIDNDSRLTMQELDDDNIIYVASTYFPDVGKKRNTKSVMFVQADGLVFYGNCDINASSGYFSLDVFEKSLDSIEEKIEIGYLSADETQKLNNYISAVDFNSACENSKADEYSELPCVLMSDINRVECIVYDSSHKPSSFQISTSGYLDNHYVTFDENAIKARDIVGNSDCYKKWLFVRTAQLGDIFNFYTLNDFHSDLKFTIKNNNNSDVYELTNSETIQTILKVIYDINKEYSLFDITENQQTQDNQQYCISIIDSKNNINYLTLNVYQNSIVINDEFCFYHVSSENINLLVELLNAPK